MHYSDDLSCSGFGTLQQKTELFNKLFDKVVGLVDSSTFSILTLIGSQHIDLCMSTFSVTIVDLILQICLLDLLWIRPLISLDVYCGLLLVGNAIKCYLNLLAVCFVRALLSSYLFFRFRSAMPPRHSKRTHATLSEAITVAAATEPTRQK